MEKEGSLLAAGVSLSTLGWLAQAFPTLSINTSWTNYAIYGGIFISIAGSIFVKPSKWDRIFTACGLGANNKIPKLLKKQVSDKGEQYIFNLPEGLCLSDLQKQSEPVSQYLNKSIEWEVNNRTIILTLTDKKLKRTYPFVPIHTDSPVAFCFAHTINGHLIIDLENLPSPHMGIFGESNGGKSVIARDIITQLVIDKTEENSLEMYLIDPKRVEFSKFKDCKIVKAVVRDEEDILSTLTYLLNETDRRYKLLEKAGVEKLKYYNEKKQKLKYILCIIDEFADLSNDKEMITKINYIARKSRAVGIHLILCTQRPDKDVLDGKIKANIGNIIGLRTTTEINSRMIIDSPGLEKLKGYGHGIFKNGSEQTEFQSMYIDTDPKNDQLKKLIAPYCEPKTKPETTKKYRGYI